MNSSAQTVLARGSILSLGWLYRRSRAAAVRVMAGGHEVDGFQASDPETLRDCLVPVYKHLDQFRGTVLFEGADERWLVGRIGQARRVVSLDSLDSATCFLAGADGHRGHS